MPVTYEWDIEEMDGDEIVNHDHRDRVHEFDGESLTRAVAEDGFRLALVRDDDNGRSWAYVKDGELQTNFLDAYDRVVAKVPVRFIKEFKL